MGVCCVDGCEPSDKDDVTYFPFPVKPTLRRKWREAIRTSTKLHVDSKVCSRHFNSDDYERVRGKLRLKGRVVPSLFHYNKKEQSKSPSASPNRNGASTPPQIPPDPPQTPPHPSQTSPHPSQTSPHPSESPPPPPQSPLPTRSPPQCLEDPPAGDTVVQEIYSAPDFVLETCLDNGDDSAENCTIECVPEAILDHGSDSHSDTDLHKEDIEDIIANYHIKQNKKLVERLKAAQECEKETYQSDIERGSEREIQGSEKETQSDSGKQGNNNLNHGSDKITQESDSEKQEKENEKQDRDRKRLKQKEKKDKGSQRKKERKDRRIDTDSEVIEVEDEMYKAPVFIEMAVGSATNMSTAGERDDCMILLENVEVTVDPSALMLDQEQDDADPDRKEDPISLLTSSDDDDVIIQEPHIDTVEVSDETDEDDMPLVKLVKPKEKKKASALGKIFWGNRCEYFCYQCNFKTSKNAEFKLHKLSHSKVIHVCEVCNFATASKCQFDKHKKKHKDEKRFKCHLCDYKAKHNMSLVYHLKSHGILAIESVNLKDKFVMKKMKLLQCSHCKFETYSKVELIRHIKECLKGKKYKCDLCDYQTKRRSDLRRHKDRRHKRIESVDLEDDE